MSTHTSTTSGRAVLTLICSVCELPALSLGAPIGERAKCVSCQIAAINAIEERMRQSLAGAQARLSWWRMLLARWRISRLRPTARVVAFGFLWTQIIPWLWADQPCRDDRGRFVECDSVVEKPVTPIVDPLPSGPAPGYEPKPDTISVRFAAGVMAGKAADVDVRPLPAATIHVDTPLTSLENGPRLNVDVALTGLPNESVTLDSPGSVKAFDGSAAIVQPLGSVLRFSLYGRLGVASRLAAEATDSARLPGYASIGLDFHTADGDHYLQIGGGPDQRLSGEWSPSIHVTGGVKVGERSGAKLWLVGSIIRALDLAAYGYRTPSRDWWTIGVQVGR